MDYLVGYPTIKHQHGMILILFDKFSKMTILIPCNKTTTAQQSAQFFIEHVWKHYVLPTTIIFDRDARFVSTFWKNLWKQPDTRLYISTAFPPQTNGQTEVVNCLVVQLLRMYNHKHR